MILDVSLRDADGEFRRRRHEVADPQLIDLLRRQRPRLQVLIIQRLGHVADELEGVVVAVDAVVMIEGDDVRDHDVHRLLEDRGEIAEMPTLRDGVAAAFVGVVLAGRQDAIGAQATLVLGSLFLQTLETLLWEGKSKGNEYNRKKDCNKKTFEGRNEVLGRHQKTN